MLRLSSLDLPPWNEGKCCCEKTPGNLESPARRCRSRTRPRLEGSRMLEHGKGSCFTHACSRKKWQALVARLSECLKKSKKREGSDRTRIRTGNLTGVLLSWLFSAGGSSVVRYKPASLAGFYLTTVPSLPLRHSNIWTTNLLASVLQEPTLIPLGQSSFVQLLSSALSLSAPNYAVLLSLEEEEPEVPCLPRPFVMLSASMLTLPALSSHLPWTPPLALFIPPPSMPWTPPAPSPIFRVTTSNRCPSTVSVLLEVVSSFSSSFMEKNMLNLHARDEWKMEGRMTKVFIVEEKGR